MRTRKKRIGNNNPLPPVHKGEPKKADDQREVSGHPESIGGSRQGNIGHQYNPSEDHGHR